MRIYSQREQVPGSVIIDGKCLIVLLVGQALDSTMNQFLTFLYLLSL